MTAPTAYAIPSEVAEAASLAGLPDLAEPDLAALWDGLFYDNAQYVFPRGATHVMEYSDGDFTPAKTGNPPMRTLYPFVHDITVTGTSWRPQFADYELYNPIYDLLGMQPRYHEIYTSPDRVRGWVESRITRKLRAVPYCDRADLVRLHDALGPKLFMDPLVQFWIPTLDGRFWTAEELSWDIAHNWGVYIPASRIMANQGKGANTGSGGSWDTSKLLGNWN